MNRITISIYGLRKLLGYIPPSGFPGMISMVDICEDVRFAVELEIINDEIRDYLEVTVENYGK